MTAATTDALDHIREHNAQTRTWIVVLDDDPIGSQTVHGATLLVEPDPSELLRAARDHQLTFIWTNSRSLSESDAVSVNRGLIRSAIEAASIAGVRSVFVSRGDSTPRGHFRAEISAILRACEEAGYPYDGVVFAPAFLEAGRYTSGGTHWVTTSDGQAVPVAETEFARDATFGHSESSLAQWVIARTGLSPEKVKLIPAGGGRSAGVEAAQDVVMSLRDGDIAIADAVTSADLEALVLAAQSAERAGRRILYRTGPSLIRVLAGQRTRAPLTTEELVRPDHAVTGYGLTVVGSHTELTTRQVDQATLRHGLQVVELDVTGVLDESRRERERIDVIDTLRQALSVGDTALVTTRSVTTARDDPEESLAIARRISDEVCAVVQALTEDVPLDYVIAKGGITSHEVAVHGLGMRRATVLGQIFPGLVTVLRLGPETPRAGMPYVIFPGNVGDDASLADVLTTLIGVPSCS